MSAASNATKPTGKGGPEIQETVFYEGGPARGDLIVSANYQATPTVEALLAQVKAASDAKREALLLRVQRRNNPPVFIALRLR